MTPDAPRNGRRHPPRGRPAATPTASSEVGGNRDRTAPPQARQTEQGTGAGHAEGCNGSSDSSQLYTDVIRISMILRCTLVQ